MKIWHISILAATLFPGEPVFCQQQQTAKLLLEYKNLKPDTNKVSLAIKLSREFTPGNDSAFYFAVDAINWCKTLKAADLFAKAYNNLAYHFTNLRKGDSAKHYYTISLWHALQNNQIADIRDNLTSIGDLYNETILNNNDSALHYYSQGLKYALLENDTVKLIRAYSGLAATHYHLGNMQEAGHNNRQALKLSDLKNDSLLIAENLISYAALLISVDLFEEARQQLQQTLLFIDGIHKDPLLLRGMAVMFIGWSFERESKADSLIFYADKLLPIAEKAGIQYWKNGVSYWYGFYFNITGQPEKAVYHFEKALANIEDGDFNSEATFRRGLAVAYRKLKNYPEAERQLQKSIKLALLINEKGEISDGYNELYILYNLLGRHKQALDALVLHKRYNDSWVNAKSVGAIGILKNQFEEAKNIKQIALLSAENKLRSAAAARHRQEKNIAYAGIALVVLAGGYSFYRYRNRKRMQNQKAIMAERLRISRELHDEVGATLSGIAMYSHLTREQIKTAQHTEVEKSLNIMQQSAGEMVNKLNDIVWLVNPEQDSLQKLIARLEEYARDMAAIKNMQVKVNTPDWLAEHHLPIESRRNIYLFCKEAINNAVKYSQGSLLELSIKEAGNMLEFSVSDNGKGFDAVVVKRGNGLGNMQRRADEIGAKLILQSKLNEGALVSMQYNITH
jgi:two-component system sensor histidine kinase UhpB